VATIGVGDRMAKHRTPKASESPLHCPEAKDEMNLAEFPLSLLTDRPDTGRASLIFEDTTFDSSSNRTIARKLTITAPANHGLPRGTDEDVIVALIQLTKLKNGFASRKVRFTRSELIDLLGWPYNGKSYDRLTASLKRWTVASLEYDNAWWVKSEQRWTTKVFHILDECEINDSRSSKGQREFLTSEIYWNETVFHSFASGNIKDLDYRLYLKLEYTTSKRMFRFLDKRLYHKPEMIFDLKDFAFAHIGLSQTYAKNVGKIKEKLRPAIKELIEVGFLEPMTDEERYIKEGSEWKVIFGRMKPESPGSREADSEHPIVHELISRGVTPITARELSRDFLAEAVSLKLEVFDWLMAKKDKRISKNPAGYLAKSIRDDFAIPKGFKSKAQVESERLAAEKVEQDLRARKQEARASDARLKAEDAAIDVHLAALTPEQRTRLEREAFAASELNARLFGKVIVREHLRKLLGFGTES
jgi:Replication initiator protein A